MRRAVSLITMALICSAFFSHAAHGKNYASLLVKGLVSLGYPLDREDVIAIDTIGMRFDAKNRIDVLNKILQDRHTIHSMKTGDTFVKTEVIVSALRLLDEMNLPITRQIIEQLVNEQGWNPRERRLLAYMAAKRNLDFEAHTGYLISSLPLQGSDLEKEWGGEISIAILDTCDTLSFLTDLFIYKGDKKILDGLINYAGKAYGYQRENLSHRFVEIFLERPELFVNILTEKDVQQANVVVNSLVFAIWTNDVKENVDQILKKDLSGKEYAHNRVVNILRQRLERTQNTVTGH